MRRARFLARTAICIAAAAPVGACFGDKQDPEKRGFELVSKLCSPCHAVTAADISKHPQAPPFRTLGQRYRIEALEESLAEGMFTGHPDMPEFTFNPDDIGAVIAYLKSIQQK